MTPSLQLKLSVAKLRRWLSRLDALLVSGIALAALAGWFWGYSRFPDSLRRSVPMHPTTALLLITAAGSLWLCDSKPSKFKTRLGMGLAALVFIGGFARLLFQSSLPVVDTFTSTRFTMAPLTSVNLIFYGAGFFVIHFTCGRSKVLIYILGFVPALTSLLTISRCLFVNLAPQSSGQQSFPIALSAAVCFLFLTAGIALELLKPGYSQASPENDRQRPSLANELACGFGAAIFMLCGVGIFSYQSIAEFIEDSYWDNHSWQVLASIEKLDAVLAENEAAGRGLKIAGNASSLKNGLPIEAIAPAFASLQSLTQDDPLHQQQLNILRQLVQQRTQAVGVGNFAQLETLLSQVLIREEHRLDQRMADTHTNIRRGAVLISLSALIALTLVIAAGWMLNRDIGGRERAQEVLRCSEELFRGLLQSAPDAMVITSHAGEIELVNVRAEQLFGYSAQELTGQHISIILPGGMNEGELQSTESGVRKDQSSFPVETSHSPVRTPGGQSMSHAIRDVTCQRDEENRLAYLNSALSESNAQLEAANKELESFSYSVSHDLRAPLRSIDGFSQAILDDYGDKLDAEGRDHLQRVRSATQRMGQLIDDLLNLSRVTRAEMNKEQIDLSKIARDIADDLRTTVPDHDVEFVVADNVSAYTDARLIRILMTNLLSNAWKFTSKKQRAHIEFGCIGENGKSEYFVRDNGAGFDPTHSGRLFGAFQRLHSATEYAGTGIGLATAHRIVRRQGGNIWAEGKLNEGATFHFTL